MCLNTIGDSVLIFLPTMVVSMSNNNCKIQEDFGMESKIEVVSTVKVEYTSDLYKIVDALNRSLKRENLMFGLALDKENKEKAIFTIYRT